MNGGRGIFVKGKTGGDEEEDLSSGKERKGEKSSTLVRDKDKIGCLRKAEPGRGEVRKNDNSQGGILKWHSAKTVSSVLDSGTWGEKLGEVKCISGGGGNRRSSSQGKQGS